MLSDGCRRSSMVVRSSSNAFRCHTLSLRTCELLLWLMIISLTLQSRHFSPFLVSAQLTLFSPGSLNASCQNVTIQAYGGPVIVYDPGASVQLLWNPNTCQNQYSTTRSVTLIGGSLCGNASVTITTDSYYIYGMYPDSYCGLNYPSQLTIDFRSSERSVVFSASQIESGTTTTITLGGRLSFAVPSFTIVGTMTVLFTTQNSSSGLLVANTLAGGSLNVMTSGATTYQATLGSFSSIRCLLSGISTLSFTPGATLTSATVSVQGITVPGAASPVATDLNVIAASNTFTMYGSTLSISRAQFDPGNVNLFPGLRALTILGYRSYSSYYGYYYYYYSSLQLTCADTVNSRIVNVGGNTTNGGSSLSASTSLTNTTTGTTFSFLTSVDASNYGAVTLNSTQFSLVATGAFGSNGTVLIAPSNASGSSCAGASSSGVFTNVSFNGAFSATQFTVSGNQVSVTFLGNVSMSSVGIIVTQLGNGIIPCLPSNFYFHTGASLTASSFVMMPYALGAGLIQSGVVLAGSSTISIAPITTMSGLSLPAFVTINSVFAPSGFPTITFLSRGTADAMYINPDRDEPDSPSSVSIRIVMIGVSCASQQLVLGADIISSTPLLPPARIQKLSIFASNVGGGISVASGTTFVDAIVSITSCVPQLPLRNVTFLGSTSLTFYAPTSTAQVNMVGCAFLGTATIFTNNIYVADVSGVPAAPVRPSLILSGTCGSSSGITISGIMSWISISVASSPQQLSLLGSMFNSTFTTQTTTTCSMSSQTMTISLSTLEDSTLAIVNFIAVGASSYYRSFRSLIAVSNAVRSTVSLSASCALSSYTYCGVISVQTTIVEMGLTDHSVLTYNDFAYPTNPFNSLSISILKASVIDNSILRVSSIAMNNDFSGFGHISSNSRVSITNTNSDRDVQTFAMGTNLQVQDNSSVALQGSTGSTSCYSSCDLTFRPSSWLSGSSLLLDAPRLNLAITGGVFQNFTLTVIQMRALSFNVTAPLTLVHCSIQLSSTSNSYDYQLTTLPALLVMNATTFSWEATYVEAILPWVSATTAQVRMYSGTQITLSAQSYFMTSQKSLVFSSAASTLPMPGTTLDVQFPSYSMSTSVTIGSINATGSTLRLRSATTVWVSGTFTANTTLALIGVTSNASIVNMPNFIVSDYSTVVIDVVGIINPGFMLVPFQPSAITRGSRLEINAPSSLLYTQSYTFFEAWNISGSSVSSNSSIYINVANVGVNILSLTSVGCSFTIIARVITSIGAALGNSSAATYLTATSSSTAPSAMDLTSVSQGGYTNVTLIATVANTYLVDSIVVGVRMLNSNITVIGPQCSGCNGLFISGSFLTASTVSVRVLGRTVFLNDFNITSRHNAAVVSAQEVSVFGLSLVDSTLDLKVTTAPTFLSFEPRLLLRTNVSLTVIVTMTVVTYQPYQYQYSTTDNALWALLITNVSLSGGSSMALVSQYQFAGTILSPSQIPAADILPTVLTVTGSNWESGASLSLTDYRSNVQLPSSLGNSTQRGVSISVKCNTLTTFNGTYDFGASVTAAALNMSGAMSTISSVHGGSNVRIAVQGPSICTNISREFCVMDVAGGSEVNISIVDTGIISTNNTCAASLCSSLAASSSVHLEAQRVAINSIVTDSRITARAERFSVNAASALFTNSTVMLTEIGPQLTAPALPSRQAFHLRSAANSALHLSLWNPINAVVVPEVLIDATDVVESNVSLFFNGSGNANNIDAPPLRLIGTGARSNITIWSVGSYTASGVFAESSSVRVSSINGGQIALQDVIVIGSTSQHIIEVSTSSLSVRQLSNFQILVANVTAASPIVTHFDLGGVVNNNDISNCSATWVLMSNITTNNSEYQRNNTTLCSVNVTVHGDWAATKVTALVPLLDRNGAPISAAASVATSSLNINDVAPRIGHNTIIADGLGSLHATGAWSSGTRVAITRLNQLLFVNASMITSTLTVDGVQGSSLTVGVHGTITDSSVAVREWGTSSIFAAAAATRSILDIPLCILTAALARNSSVLIRGFTRRWYPGNSSTALLGTVTHFMEPTPPPTNTSTLSSPQLVSLVVSPIAILPSGVDGTSQIILEDITVSLRLPSGLTPLTSVPFSTLSPTGYVDSTVIRVNDTSLTFTAVAAQIPPPQANGGSLLSIVNASIDAQVDAVGTAMIRVAAVSASIADPSARLEVVGTAFSAIFNTTVSEVLLVEAFVAANVTKGVPTSTPRGSIVVDDANFNMTTRDDGTVQRQPLGVSLVAIRPRTEFIVVERNATVTVLWISFNESVANSSTRCDNITATYSPKLSGTTVFSCTTTYQAFVNVTTLSMTPPATTPGLLNFSATVMRTIMNVVVGSRPTSLGGDGLLRHVTAIDVRNHQTLSLALFDSIFSLVLDPVNVSNSDVPALQRFLLAAPSALVFVQNDNASSHTASLSQGTTKVTVSGVTSFDFSASMAQLININIPCVIVVAKTIVRSLSFSRLGNSSTLRAALVSLEFVPFRLPSTALAALNTTVSDTVVAADGGGGLCPLVLVTRAVIPTQILSTVVSRRRAALALDDNTNVTLPRVSLTVQRSTLQGISSALTFHATDRDDGTATMDISRSSMNIINSTLQCSGAGQTSPSYAVAALGPNDAMTMTWAISKFQNCVRLISGGDSVTIDFAANLTSTPGINWACNLWNQRSLTRSGIRELLGGVASIYLAPNIDSRYGKEICRSYSTSLMPSDSANVSSLTLHGSETATIARTLSLGFTVSHPPSKTSTASENVTITLSLSKSTSASESTSSSFSDSLSSSTSNSFSGTATPSPTDSFSPTVTSTRSDTETDSPTISIDPCNTTFRDDSDGFIRHATVLTDITQPGSNLHRNETAATFLTIDRVAFATAKSLRVQIGFSTYLRNFYYATNMSWFFVPRVQNCIADQFELVNATDLIVRISYDPDVSLSHTVDGDYACNLTFSTDIFQCQLMTNFTFNFSAAIYVSGTPSIISPASEAITKLTSTIVTLLSSGAALLQQSRADSLGTLASCQFSLVDQPSVQDSPTQLGFGSELQYYYRGLVVGNIAIIILGFVCLVFMLACAIALCGRRKVKLYGDTYAAHNVLEVSGSARIEEDVSAALTFSDVGVAEHDPMIDEDEMMTLPAFTEESNALSLDSNFLVAVNKDEDVLSAMYRETRDNVVVDLGNNNSGAFSLNPSGEGVLTSFDRDPMNIFSEEEETSKTVFESKIESGVGSEKHKLAIPAEIDCDLNASIGTRVAANEMVPSYRRPQMSNLSLIGERQETFREALQRTCGILAFPSVASIPIQLLADSTALASVRLLVHPIDSYDLHIGAAGVTVFSLFLIASGVAVKFLKRVPTDVELPATHPLAISRKRINSTVGKKTNNKITTLKLKVILWLRFWLLPTIEYSPSRMRERHNYGMMRLLFEDTSFPLFVCCDLALSLLIAALVGVGISRREVCVYLAGVGALGYIAFTALIIIARPNINRLSLAASIGGAVCGTISSLFTFISMYQGTLILGTINQYLSVVMIGISMVQFVSSVVGVVVWMRVVGVVVFSSCDALLKKVGLGNERQSIGMYHSPDGDDVDSLDGSLTPPLRTEELNESEDDEEFKEIIKEQAEGSDVDVMNTQSRRIAMIDDDDDDAARARNINDEFAHLWSYNSLAACNNSHDEVDMQLLLLNTHSISDALREFPIASSRGGEGIL